MSVTDRKARAEARKQRAVLTKTTLTGAAVDPDPIRGEAAVSLVRQLTAESWAIAGNEWPSYVRDQIPCRFVPGSRG